MPDTPAANTTYSTRGVVVAVSFLHECEL
jgi:hypothetical protein